jgi:hypothetical protein
LSNYAIIPNRGIYYFSKRKKTKFVPLFKICKVNGTTLEEFHQLIELIEITLKNDTTKQQTDPRPNILGGGNPGRDTN